MSPQIPKPYRFEVILATACIGMPVRFKGEVVGTVVSVRPRPEGLEGVYAVIVSAPSQREAWKEMLAFGCKVSSEVVVQQATPSWISEELMDDLEGD